MNVLTAREPSGHHPFCHQKETEKTQAYAIPPKHIIPWRIINSNDSNQADHISNAKTGWYPMQRV